MLCARYSEYISEQNRNQEAKVDGKCNYDSLYKNRDR